MSKSRRVRDATGPPTAKITLQLKTLYHKIESGTVPTFQSLPDCEISTGQHRLRAALRPLTENEVGNEGAFYMKGPRKLPFGALSLGALYRGYRHPHYVAQWARPTAAQA